MRRAAATDANQQEIVDALRGAGCSVQCLHTVGGGVPGLLVGRRARVLGCAMTLYLLEVKDGAKPPSARRLTPDQADWHRHWPVAVVTSVDEALRAVGLPP